LKPWHLKATYQLYDEKGKPTEQGSFEYWWASPKLYRSTWTRPGATHTDWHTADGKGAHQDTGKPLDFFEYKLQDGLLAPLPDSKELDPANYRLDRQNLSVGKTKIPCMMAVPRMPYNEQLKFVPLGLFPTYCFDPQTPALVASHSFGSLLTEYNHIVKVQNKYLAREITLLDGTRKILTATVDSITGLNPSNPALIPTVEASATSLEKVPISAGVMQGMLIKKQTPVYPQEAKDARISGTVVLKAIIGRDGYIYDLRVISAPAPCLAISAMWAVSKWQYKPYLLVGEPVAVETTVNVIYSLGD